ncbi:MAG: ABC transporter permease subunit [Eubacteriales bacterium]|nr:ABC transporter permease subunit [Eubacteriales bacterium]
MGASIGKKKERGKAALRAGTEKRSWKQDWKKNYQLYLFLIPAVVSVFIFSYLPMYGIQIAFKDFKPVRGILGSEWVGMKWFERFFSSFQFTEILGNTLLLSVLLLICSFPVPILFALIVNQYREGRFRRVLQTVSYAPHFISTVVMVGMVVLFLSPSAGLYGTLMRMFGLEAENILGEASMFRPIYILSDIWQHTGWDSIIYLAALSSISQDLYDAAKVDGAGRWKRMWYIEIPALRETAMILLILRLGGIMSMGFEKAYLLQNNLNLAASEIIATYVYKIGLTGTPQYSYSAAIGVFNSVINVFLLLTFNKLSKKMSGAGLW